MSTVVTALAGVVFGLALAAPPGPMNAIIAAESVVRGWTAGFRAGLGAMSADALFFVLALAGVVAVIDRIPTVRPALYLAGGALMLYFAIGAVEDARSTSSFTAAGGGDGDGDDDDNDTGAGHENGVADLAGDEDVKDAPDESNGFRKTFVLSLTNPYQIGFWLTVGVGLLEAGTLDVFAHVPAVGDALGGSMVVQTGSPALLLDFFGGIAIWIVAYPAALAAAGRRIDVLAPIIAALSAAVLAGFGALFLVVGTMSIV